MIHEHEATELASAAIDFGLAPDVERELNRELAECPICAERAAAYREQLRFMQRLPVVDASDRVRRRVTSAALTGRTESRSPMLLLAAAALLLGLALAGVAVAGALLAERGPLEFGVNEVTPSPTLPTGPAPEATSAEPSSVPASRPAGPAAGAIPQDSVAEVVTTNLRVRSEPRVADDSIMLEPFLQPGDRLFVTEGPVRANDYDWYRVAPISRDPNTMWDERPLGWVARADHDGTPWIEPRAPACPSAPADIAAVAALPALDRIACFRSDTLSLLAVVDGDPTSGWSGSAGARPDPRNVSPSISLAPALGRVRNEHLPSQVGQPNRYVMQLDGSFDRTDLTGCTPAPDDPTRELMELLMCRSQFVLDAVSPNVNPLMASLPAVTVTDDLRVRSLPFVGPESVQYNLLNEGTPLFLLDGPTIGSGYVWFRVVVPSVAGDRGPLAGWVAISGKDGEPWVSQAGVDCPSPDVLSFDEFRVLTSPPLVHGGLVCYGQQLVRVDARVRIECADDPWNSDPNWMLDPGRTMVLGDGSREVRVARTFNPDELACEGELSDIVYRIGGHFDDSTAMDCTAGGAVADPRLNEVALYECRTKFIVTEMYPAGS